MSENKAPQGENLKEYAGGWIMERKGTDAPGFLKLAIPIISLFCTGYLVYYMNGEVDHAERGEIVRKFNEWTQGSPGLMYAIAGCALVYAIVVIVFAIGKVHEE